MAVTNMIDLIGQKFGYLTVISKAGNTKHGKTRWLCKCICDKEHIVTGYYLRKGLIQSCGCIDVRIDDLTNKTFGNLKVVGIHEKKNGIIWKCECTCGNNVYLRGADLKSGHDKSCGCKRKKPYGESSFTTILNNYKRNAYKRNLSFELTNEQFKELTQQNCFYCGTEPKQKMEQKYSNGPFIYNGIDRVDNSKGYTIDNVVPCCGMCNQMKSGFSKEEWINHIKKIIDRMDK